MLRMLLLAFLVIGLGGILIGAYQAHRFPQPEDPFAPHPGDAAYDLGILGLFGFILLFFIGPLIHFWINYGS